MSDINVSVLEQQLQLTSTPTVAAQGVNEDYIVFDFLDNSWSGYSMVALFFAEDNPEAVYQSVVNSAGRALVPWEATQTDGAMYFGLAGVNGNIRYTSELVRYKIVAGLYEGAESVEPTPSVYEQWAAAVSEYAANVADLTGDVAELSDRLDIAEALQTDTMSGSKIVTYTSDALTAQYDSALQQYYVEYAVALPAGASVLETAWSRGASDVWQQSDLRTTMSASTATVRHTLEAQSAYTFKIRVTISYPESADLAELQDIRMGADGTVYTSAGAAVRAQAMQLNSTLTEAGKAADAKATGDAIADLKDDLNGKITNENLLYPEFEQGGITLSSDQSLIYAEDNTICRLKEGDVILGYTGATLKLRDKTNYMIRVRRAVYQNWSSINSGNWFADDLQLGNNYKYVFDIRRTDWHAFTPSECENLVNIVYPESKVERYNETYYKSFALGDELVYNGYFLASREGVPTGTETAKVSRFIPVKSGMKLSYKLSAGVSSGVYVICVYDANYQFVSGIEGIGTGTLIIENDGYIRIGNANNYDGYLYFNYNIPDIITNELNALDTDITENSNRISKDYTEQQNVIKSDLESIVPYKQASWRIGYVSPTTGDNATADNRISLTAVNFVGEYMGLKYIEAKAGYVFNLAAYEEDGTYIGAWDGTTFSKSWSWKFISEAYLPNYSNYKYRITVKKTDDSTITTDDYTNIVFWFAKGNNYYMQTGLNTIVSTLKDKSELGNIVVFGFNTDQHIWSENKGAVLRGLRVLSQASHKYPYDFICLGGDACEAGAHSTSFKDILDNCVEIQEPLYDASCPVVPITGNHDAAQNNENITGGMLFNAHFKRIANSGFLSGWDNTHTNGYWDSEAHKIRFIFFDDTVRADYTSTQRRNALIAMLSNVPQDYKIVIFSHHVLSSALTNAGWANPIGMQNILNPYASKIICCICGHSHKDLSEISDGILYIATTMAALGNDADGNIRRNYTPTETAYDTFVIDQNNQHIYALRYGFGSNRDWTYTLT